MQQQTSSPQLRFYPYSPALGDNPSCESPGCRNVAAWWEETHNAFLCDGCAVAFEGVGSSASPVSPLEQYKQVMLYAADLLLTHCRSCAYCQRMKSLLTAHVASVAIAECLAKNDGLAWAVRDRLVTINALAELVQVHVCGKVR